MNTFVGEVMDHDKKLKEYHEYKKTGSKKTGLKGKVANALKGKTFVEWF